jgi:hypothetical protein
MPTPKERLSHLLELAAQGAGERTHLAGEVAELLLDWPPSYPGAMRATFEALLEKIVGEMAPADCADIADRFAGRDDVPLPLFNAFFFSATSDMQDEILARNDTLEPVACLPFDVDALLHAARVSRHFTPALAEIVGLSEPVAAAMLADASGRGLAVLARGAGMARASFSALAILAGPVRSVAENFAMLAAYDRVPPNGARHLLRLWRSHAGPLPAHVAAA